MPDSESRPSFRPLRDEAIELRALEPQDAAVTIAWRNDPEIRDQLLSFRFPVSHVTPIKSPRMSMPITRSRFPRP